MSWTAELSVAPAALLPGAALLLLASVLGGLRLGGVWGATVAVLVVAAINRLLDRAFDAAGEFLRRPVTRAAIVRRQLAVLLAAIGVNTALAAVLPGLLRLIGFAAAVDGPGTVTVVGVATGVCCYLGAFFAEIRLFLRDRSPD